MMYASRRLLTITLLASAIGCERQSPAPPPPLPPTPQDRFDRIVETLRDQLEDHGKGGSVGRITIRDSAGVGSSSYSYRVEALPSELPPQVEGKRLTAMIKVTFETTYSATRARAPEEDEEEEENEEPKRNQSPAGENLFSDSDPTVLDTDLVPELPSTSRGPSLSPPDLPTKTQPSVTVSIYQLEYYKDKWRFAAPPSHDALPSANDAMELALKRQG